jgi:hypothetical protein
VVTKRGANKSDTRLLASREARQSSPVHAGITAHVQFVRGITWCNVDTVSLSTSSHDPMDRISSIFARLESRRPFHPLTSDVIGHVLPRASVSGGGVFSGARSGNRGVHAANPPPRAGTPTEPESRPTPFGASKATINYLAEASLARRMEDVAVCTTTNLPVSNDTQAQAYTPSATQPTTVEVPVRPLIPSSEAWPLPAPSRTTLPSVRTFQASMPCTAKSKRKRIRVKTDRRREQCRANQARYRKRQSEYSKELKTSVWQLRQELPILERQHSRLTSSARSTVLHVVIEYFHLFRNGTRRADQIGNGPEAWLQNSEARQQLAFLQSSMTSDVLLGEQQGVDALMQQWRRYTSYFDDLQFHLEHVTKVTNDFIAATASLHVTISESTFQHVFPYLLTGGQSQHYTPQEDKTAVLRAKLLGQRVSLSCRLCFEWDKANKRVMRLERTVDFLPSLMQVIASIADAAFVLEHALIAQDGRIGQPVQ